MDIPQFVDIFLHLDKHLAQVAGQWGASIYALLFAIVFIETGLVVMPLLPGDSLLFVAGALAGIDVLDYWTLTALLLVAAVLGDNLNYVIGRRLGSKVWGWRDSRLFDRDAFERTHGYFERWGPMTVIIARFIPFARTFAPFVAGVGAMPSGRFFVYNVVGGVLWVGGLLTLGYCIGNHPWVQAHFSWVALAMIVGPGLPAVFVTLRQMLRRRGPAA